MIKEMALEELQELHGKLRDAIDANKALIHLLTSTKGYSVSYVRHVANINGSLMRLDEDVCLRINELR